MDGKVIVDRARSVDDMYLMLALIDFMALLVWAGSYVIGKFQR